MLHPALRGAALLAALPTLALAAPASTDLQTLRDEIAQLKQAYEQRISALEARLAQTESASAQAAADARSAETKATELATASSLTQRPSAAAGEAAFNPGISAILTGTYTNLRRNPDKTPYAITGFIPSNGEVAPPRRSFTLGESELVIAGNIDPMFRGQLIVALPPDSDESPQVEEAFIQTLGLSNGFNVKAGRFLSGIGYMNEQHAHAWDFSDAPLPYKAFLGNQLRNDGVQVKWLAPTDTFIELGFEAARGNHFPSTDTGKNGVQSSALFAHVGGDWNASHNWRAGLSYVTTRPQARSYTDVDGAGFETGNTFSGRSHLWIADAIWKWAPNGNSHDTALTLQAEYFQRKEDGTLGVDSTAAGGALSASDSYRATQSGGYAQAVYKFAPGWRVGYRLDRLNHGTVNLGTNLNPADLPILAAHDPSRNTLMVDWSPSEFSRVRLQYAQDKSRLGVNDDQVWVQYIMSLGAHGAHKY